MAKLQDKVAIITGGASGIGAATVKLFVENGAKVVIVDLNEEKGKAFEQELKGKGADVLFIKANITNEEEVQNIFSTTVEKYSRVDVLFNNAGIGRVTPTEELSYSEWRNTVNVDLDGVFLVAQAGIKEMLKQAAVRLLILLQCMAGSVQQDLQHTMQQKAGLLI